MASSINYISKTVRDTTPRPLREAVFVCMDINHHVFRQGLMSFKGRTSRDVEQTSR